MLNNTKKEHPSEKDTLYWISRQWINSVTPSLKDSSVNKYEDLLRCYILPYFEGQSISQINSKDIKLLVDELLISGGKNQQGLSKTTISEVLSVMNRLRHYADSREIPVSFSTESIHLKRISGKVRVFSLSEEKTLIQWLCNNYDRTALSVLLCLFSGIRIGEVCALTWEDFDFTQGVLSITKTMQRIRLRDSSTKKTSVRITPPKSECSIRTIPIADNIKDYLLSERGRGTYILPGSKKPYVEPRTLQNRFHAILSNAGIKNANFHTLRHTFATRCIEQGMDVKCLSEILGHSSVSITLNRYVHPSLSLKIESINKLSSAFPLKEE